MIYRREIFAYLKYYADKRLTSSIANQIRTLHDVQPSTTTEDVNEENQHDRLAEAVTPLWKIPYEEQLKIKQDKCENIINDFEKKVRNRKRKPFKFVYCLEAIRPSPVTTAYRNKDEFNIRTGVDGNPKTVGFFIGKPCDGPVTCVRGTHLINMKQSHKRIAQAFEDYIRTSQYAALHDFHDGGHWQRIIVRSNSCGDTMALAVFHPRNLSFDIIKEEVKRLKDFFINGAGASCGLNTLYFQTCCHTRCTHEESPFILLFGEPYLTETLSGKSFRISPDSFFQVNKEAAEILYENVIYSIGPNRRTTLLDLCCGTGTISILASDYVRGAVGIDNIADAIRDARFNANYNGITNTEFLVGRIEQRLRKVLSELELSPDIVAVMNPTRSGVSSKVIQKLCECKQIRKLVYISCMAEHPITMSNFVELITNGEFVLSRVTPVDLFPHTYHTELILEFRR